MSQNSWSKAKRCLSTLEHKRMRQSIQMTAYHEAGHAVAGFVARLPIGNATIVPDRKAGCLGSVIVENPLRYWKRGDGPRKPFLEAYVVMLYAGDVAESVCCGKEIEISSKEIERARNTIANWIRVPGARFLGDDMFERYERKLQRRARQLVMRHRRLIERLAAQLLKHKTLSSDEMVAFLEKTSR